MSKVLFRAPAKINLCLHVLGRREDGYHELAMAMQRVSLYDDITVQVAEGDGVAVCCDGLSLAAGEENIAARAARLVLAVARVRRRVSVSIDKHIPVAAGLGGGSSDAAAVLIALNDLLQVGMTAQDLMGLGAQLGADVPFFIFSAPAWATGTGTCLRSLSELPSVSYILVNPGIAVSTKDVYQSLQLTKGGDLASIPTFSARTPSELCRGLHNDLEQVVLPRHPEVGEAKDLLLAAGAMGALMSGSGATVFGVSENKSSANRIADKIKAEKDWFVQVVDPV